MGGTFLEPPYYGLCLYWLSAIYRDYPKTIEDSRGPGGISGAPGADANALGGRLSQFQAFKFFQG